jgi:predicted kinase
MSRHLLLVGGSAGTGKSTVARTVATRIGAAWLQLDAHAESVRLAWLYGNWLADQAGAASLPVVASRPYETAPNRVLDLAGVPPQA